MGEGTTNCGCQVEVARRFVLTRMPRVWPSLGLDTHAGWHCGQCEVLHWTAGAWLLPVCVVLWFVPSLTKPDPEVRVNRAYSLCFI